MKRLDRVICNVTQGVFLYTGDRGTVLNPKVAPEDLMRHEDPNEPKAHVLWDAKWMRNPKTGELVKDCLSSTHTNPDALRLAPSRPEDPLFQLEALLYDRFYPEVDTDITEADEHGVWHMLVSDGNNGFSFPVEFDPNRPKGFVLTTDFVNADLSLEEIFEAISIAVPVDYE